MKITALGALVGTFGFLLVVGSLCRALPVSSATKAGYYIDPHILTYAPSHTLWYSIGWDLRNPQLLKTNGHGFVSEREFTRDERAIALIGDSMVVAHSLDAADRPGAQLERALGGRRPVFSMGSGGTSLLDYAERIRFAHEQFGVRDFVVLMERGDVVQALCGSGNVASQCLDRITLAPRTESIAPASAQKRVLREVALAQYLVSQLKVEPEKLLRQVFTRTVPGAGRPMAPALAVQAAMPEVDAVTAEFFARVKPHVRGQLVIAIDADRQQLKARHKTYDAKRARFISLARAAGATVVDLAVPFAEHYGQSALSLDVSPSDGHYNRLGVQLVAKAMAQAIAPRGDQGTRHRDEQSHPKTAFEILERGAHPGLAACVSGCRPPT